MSKSLKTASLLQKYEVTSHDLPLSCPMPDMTLWNSHPKVYLPIQNTGKAKCPYCGAEYVMTDFEEFKNKKGH